MKLEFTHKILIFSFIIFQLFNCSGRPEKSKFNGNFSSMENSQKRMFLDSLINNEYTISFAVDLKLNNEFKRRIKYPETLQYKTPLGNYQKSSIIPFLSNSKIINENLGRLKSSGDFMSKNKLNLDVRGSYNVVYDVKGTDFKIVEFKVE